MSIICPGHSYHEALDIMNFKELAIHHDEICDSLFDTIVNDNNHCLYKSQPVVLRIVLLFLHVLKGTHLSFPFFFSRVDPI